VASCGRLSWLSVIYFPANAKLSLSHRIVSCRTAEPIDIRIGFVLGTVADPEVYFRGIWRARERETITGVWGGAVSGLQGRAPGQGVRGQVP